MLVNLNFVLLNLLCYGVLLCAVGLQVLGEAYSTHDEEDMAVKEVTAISISQGRSVNTNGRNISTMEI